MAATAGCLGSPLSPTFLTSLALLSLTQLSFSVPIYRQEWCHSSSSSLTKMATNSISSSTMVAANL